MPPSNKASDHELSYASASSGSSSSHGLSSRSRRSNGSNDDEDDVVYPEGFVNLDLRVGGPYLAPVPVIGSMVPSHLKHLEELQNPPHRANIDKILSTWRVQDRGYCVAMRSGKNYPEDELIPTLVVDAAKRRGGESWIDAALEIRQYVKQHGFEEVNVEIANDEAFRPAHTFPVLKTDAVYSKWDDVCKTILGELDLTDWVLLECFRFGCEKDAEQNPPTVIVTVARDSSRKWRASRDQIISILTRFSLLDVAVVFQKGYMHRGVGLLGREVPRSAWDGKAKLGVSLSSVNDPDSSATFGGYVQLQNKKGNWHKFGIACYHAVLPSLKGQTPNSHLRTLVGNWSKNGVLAGDKQAKAWLTLQQPSQADVQATLDELRTKIALGKTPAFQQNEAKAIDGKLFGPELRQHQANRSQLSHLENFEQKILDHHTREQEVLGNVFAASGFFTTKRSNGVDLMHMDWSLIRMEKDRMGNNMVSQITCTLFYVPLTCIRNDADGAPMPPLRTDILNPARALEEDLIVFKLGRSTGWTWGTLSGLRSASITTADEHGKENKIVTMENVVTGRKHGAPFSERGDSGSFVFDANLAVVGMVFAGDSNYGNAYIIPCAELFEDIKRQTGAQDVRISLI